MNDTINPVCGCILVHFVRKMHKEKVYTTGYTSISLVRNRYWVEVGINDSRMIDFIKRCVDFHVTNYAEAKKVIAKL